MTPEEKIEYVKRQIDEKTQISPKSPVHINLYTFTEYEDGPTLISNSEQRLIIKKLEEDGFIKNVVWDGDFSVWIEVVLGEKQKLDEDFKQSLFLLKTFYSKILEVLDAFAGGYIAVRNTVINHYYTLLTTLIDDTLNKEGFGELKNDKPELFESLIGNIEDFDVEWEFGSKKAYDFLGRIEKLYILSGSPIFSLPDELKTFLQKTDEAINEHKKYCSERWQKMQKNMEKQTEVLKEQWGETVETKCKKNIEKQALISEPNKYKISVKDREIWVNNYLIGKPHAVGSNFEFFEYIRSKTPHTLIERNKMPNAGDGIGYGYIKETIKNKGFIKILNGLGFKGEILKAFFYKRGKDTLIYRGDEIVKKDLEKAGVKTSLFLKELELAHTKNSPE